MITDGLNARTNRKGRLDGKIAVITGANGGIGQGIVDLFTREGAKVAALDIQPRCLSDDRVEGLRYWQSNVADEDSVRETAAQVKSYFGGIDILINAAGVTGPNKMAHEATEREFDTVFDVNVKGTWLPTKHIVPEIRRRGGGSIVNFSSIAGLVGGTSAQTLYHATKGAVRMMTKADAINYSGVGIRVNSIHPGSIETPLSRSVAQQNPLGADAHDRKVFASHPLGRRGTPRDIAFGALYLASDESAFVTGAELVIDGGYTAR